MQNFSLPKKNGGHRGKISVVDMVNIGFLYPPRAWKVSLFIFFSFGGARVRFSLLCVGHTDSEWGKEFH